MTDATQRQKYQFHSYCSPQLQRNNLMPSRLASANSILNQNFKIVLSLINEMDPQNLRQTNIDMKENDTHNK